MRRGRIEFKIFFKLRYHNCTPAIQRKKVDKKRGGGGSIPKSRKCKFFFQESIKPVTARALLRNYKESHGNNTSKSRNLIFPSAAVPRFMYFSLMKPRAMLAEFFIHGTILQSKRRSYKCAALYLFFFFLSLPASRSGTDLIFTVQRSR